MNEESAKYWWVPFQKISREHSTLRRHKKERERRVREQMV
jgi:hypothetical protein